LKFTKNRKCFGPQAEERLLEFTRSELFARTFREGMDLVEETAAYLDGPGRADSKKLPRDHALTYASQSMRLTTRLMQVASWLLVQRALKENEMTGAEAREEKRCRRYCWICLPDQKAFTNVLFALTAAFTARSMPKPVIQLPIKSAVLRLRSGEAKKQYPAAPHGDFYCARSNNRARHLYGKYDNREDRQGSFTQQRNIG